MSRFRSATRDELYVRGRVVEERLWHGSAIFEDGVITATDDRDDQLVDLCDLEPLRAAMPANAFRVRLIADARLEDDTLTTSSTLTISSTYGFSVVTTPEHAEADYELLRRAVVPSRGEGEESAVQANTPLLWRNGSASVLLHEAIGHALEHDAPHIAWPEWLAVDVQFAMRRETFRDVPLKRMQRLIARQHGAPFELPSRRVEVLLVHGGAYDPLTDAATVRIAAATLIDGEAARPLAPFEIVQPRAAVARALVGAEGEPQRYPGVVCSREGQELVVGSQAPTMLTVFR